MSLDDYGRVGSEDCQQVGLSSPPLTSIYTFCWAGTSCDGLSLWEQVRRENEVVVLRRMPSNAFEEMIQLTEEGKLWKYPMDNEQGMYPVNLLCNACFAGVCVCGPL